MIDQPEETPSAESVIRAFMQRTGRERFPIYGSHYVILLEVMDAAITAEREACAAIAREQIDQWMSTAESRVAERIAEAIEARGQAAQEDQD